MTKQLISVLALPFVLTLAACNDNGSPTPAPQGPQSRNELPGNGGSTENGNIVSAGSLSGKGEAGESDKGHRHHHHRHHHCRPMPEHSHSPGDSGLQLASSTESGPGHVFGNDSGPGHEPGHEDDRCWDDEQGDHDHHHHRHHHHGDGKDFDDNDDEDDDMAISSLSGSYFTVSVVDTDAVKRLVADSNLRLVNGQLKSDAEFTADDHAAASCAVKKAPTLNTAAGSAFRMPVDPSSTALVDNRAHMSVASIEGFQVECMKAQGDPLKISDLDDAFGDILNVSLSE